MFERNFCVTLRKYLLSLSCSDIIIDQIVACNCGGITKQTIFSYLLIVSHLGFLTCILDIRSMLVRCVYLRFDVLQSNKCNHGICFKVGRGSVECTLLVVVLADVAGM